MSVCDVPALALVGEQNEAWLCIKIGLSMPVQLKLNPPSAPLLTIGPPPGLNWETVMERLARCAGPIFTLQSMFVVPE